MFTIIGPFDNQTEWDYWIQQFWNLRNGTEEEQIMAKVLIRNEALHELDKPESEDSSKRGFNRDVKVYHLSESVHRDLEVYDYGRMPFTPHVFPVADSLTVVGDLHGAHTGFALDFYTKEVKPTQTLAFTKGVSPEVLREAVESVFKFQNAESRNAYVERRILNRAVDLRRFGLEDTFDGLAIEGEVVFGGNGRTHREIMKEMVANYESLEGFVPKEFAVCSYNFSLTPSVGRPGWKEGYDKLKDSVYGLLKEKAEKAAA